VASSSVNKKAAPRRLISRIEKIGSWGQVEWLHHLECGHAESRKRKAGTEYLACTGCVLAKKHEEQVNQTKRQVELLDLVDDPDVLDPLGVQLAAGERSVAQIRAELSTRLGVPSDSIEVIVDDESGELGVSYALVLLTAEEIRRVIA
jgi:hypothetical protein